MKVIKKNYQVMQKLGDDEYLLLHPETNANNVLIDVEDIEADNAASAFKELKKITDNKASISAIPDVSQFITKTVNDLINYYTAAAIDERLTEIESKVSSIPKFSIRVVTERPEVDISETTIYLQKTSNDDENLYTEYIYIDGAWETLGTQSLNLSGYATENWVKNLITEFITEARVQELIAAAAARTAETADKLASARKISLSGDATGETTFDGSQDKTISVELSKTGVEAGIYSVVSVDDKGRVTNGGQVVEIGIAGQIYPSDTLAVGGLFLKQIL